jgi:hypothetical protein
MTITAAQERINRVSQKLVSADSLGTSRVLLDTEDVRTLLEMARRAPEIPVGRPYSSDDAIA